MGVVGRGDGAVHGRRGAVVGQLQVHAVRGALRCHHALQHVEGRLVCLVGETRGQRALQRGDAASVRGHLPVRGGQGRRRGQGPAKKSDDAIGDELHDWIGKGVRVVSEKAGPLKYGRSGSVSNVKDGTASIMTEKGVISTQMEFLMLEDATWKKPRAHRTFQYITRASLQSMLQAIAAHPEPFVDTTYPLLGVDADTYLEDQHIVLAWAWMQWQLNIPESVQCLDPALMGKLTVNMTEMDEAGYELVKGQTLDCASGVDTLCILPMERPSIGPYW